MASCLLVWNAAHTCNSTDCNPGTYFVVTQRSPMLSCTSLHLARNGSIAAQQSHWVLRFASFGGWKTESMIAPTLHLRYS